MGLRHLRSPELLLGEVDGPEWNPEPENGATSNKKSELKLPVGHLLDFVHLWCMHVVRGIRATHVHRAGGVEPPRGGSLPSRAETSDGKKGSVSENSKPGEEKSSGETGVVPELGFGRRSARATTHPQEGSLLGRELLQRVHCQLRRHRLILLFLFCTASKPWRALARFDFQTLKFEIGFCRSGWFSTCVPDLT